MEDHYSPCWPAAAAEANWVQTSAAVYDESLLVPCPSHASASASASANFQVYGFPPWSVPLQEASEDKAASSSKSHSQAEKRRRDRINAQLGILRKLIPKSEKVHKSLS
uniref:BHLH domain-containing protein n=1 Tax=Populus davidiana TaxID=266767 RepID=A0A6M2EQE4_9ROSI